MPQPNSSDFTIAPTAAEEGVEEIVKRAGSSFFWAMRFLPPTRRQAMFAVYAFCRVVDDIADGTQEKSEKLLALETWQHEIDALYAGAPRTPLAAALAEPVARFKLKKESFMAIIEGMKTDANEAMQGPSQQELELYCARVAGAVGELSTRIFGTTPDLADELAHTLGEALQFTNILRDIHEDAAIGRLYLPDELLTSAGITSRQPAMVIGDPNLVEVCEKLALQAEQRFKQSEILLSQAARHTIRPALVMMKVYRRILEKLRTRGWTALEQKVALSKPEKLWIAFRHGIL